MDEHRLRRGGFLLLLAALAVGLVLAAGQVEGTGRAVLLTLVVVPVSLAAGFMRVGRTRHRD